MHAPSPLFTIRQLIAAWGDGHAMTDFLGPDLAVSGTPPFAGLLDTDLGPANRKAAIAADGWAILERDLQLGTDGRVLGEGVWTHDEEHRGQHGSAGAFQVAFTVRNGLVVEIRFFEDHAAARAFVGLS